MKARAHNATGKLIVIWLAAFGASLIWAALDVFVFGRFVVPNESIIQTFKREAMLWAIAFPIATTLSVIWGLSWSPTIAHHQQHNLRTIAAVLAVSGVASHILVILAMAQIRVHIPFVPTAFGLLIPALATTFVVWTLVKIGRLTRYEDFLCAGCGYDLRYCSTPEAAMCPECGSARQY